MAETCDRRIKWGTESMSDCEKPAGHDGEHVGPGLSEFPYQRIHWQEDDRRTFTGEWVECPQQGCVLPAGHPRGHAF